MKHRSVSNSYCEIKLDRELEGIARNYVLDYLHHHIKEILTLSSLYRRW